MWSVCKYKNNITMINFEMKVVMILVKLASRSQCGPRGGGSQPTPPNVCMHTHTCT